jgi:hypothetical protein
LLTKRLLGLADLWVAGSNGVQIQIYATWIFYLVLIDLGSEVAVALRQPLIDIPENHQLVDLDRAQMLTRGDIAELRD